MRELIHLLTVTLLITKMSAEPLWKDYSNSAKTTKSFAVHEGLPHQKSEYDLLVKEFRTKPTSKLAGFPFYHPGTEANNAEKIRKWLSTESNFSLFEGEKDCGGFHPDYAIQWTQDKVVFSALICFGCQEIIFISGNKKIRLDITHRAAKEAQILFKRYHKKRPKVKSQTSPAN